jgi:hypothetical protein
LSGFIQSGGALGGFASAGFGILFGLPFRLDAAWGQCQRRLIICQRMPGAKPEGLIAEGQRNSLCRSDSNAPEELFKQLPGSGSESAIALQGLELAPHRRACGVSAVSRDQLPGEAFHRIGGQDAPQER